MKLTIEDYDRKEKMLIVDKQGHQLSITLKQELDKYDNEVYISPGVPKNIVLL